MKIGLHGQPRSQGILPFWRRRPIRRLPRYQKGNMPWERGWYMVLLTKEFNKTSFQIFSEEELILGSFPTPVVQQPQTVPARNKRRENYHR